MAQVKSISSIQQEEFLNEIVLPLLVCEIEPTSKVLTPIELIGTGFLIGCRGFALTAAHVIDQLNDAVKNHNRGLFAYFQNDKGTSLVEIVEFEKHPTEDIGVIKLAVDSIKFSLNLSIEARHPSCPYVGWGYPKESAEELKYIVENAGLRPTLIYTEGYVRRRINTELSSSIYIGSKFYEVSDLGGPGYSGSPIIYKLSMSNQHWGDVIGVYIGEKEGHGSPVGYVVRMQDIGEWECKLLGCSLYSESKNKLK